uniref:Uncharacterized protein n=1 Tax=Strongyloides papillosus TaxID=174720 RepID=A0A0N5BTN5_STREA
MLRYSYLLCSLSL